MSTDALAGQEFGQYRLERLLEGGKETSAYLGYDLQSQRQVSIKVFDLHPQIEPDHIRRFIETARAAIMWQHENVVQVYDVVVEDDLCFIVTDFVSGQSLSELLQQYRADDELMLHADVLRIGGAIASALDYAHQRNVLHGAVWSTNVLIGINNRIVLLDFERGMPLVGEKSLRKGKRMPQYTAPEQARNIAATSPQSDFYSLGIILYEMLTGSLPFDDPSPSAVTLRHMMTEPPSPRTINPNLNAETEAVLLKALAKDPADRYSDGHALTCALEKTLLPGPDKPVLSESSAMLAAIAAPALSAMSVDQKLRLYQAQTASPLSHMTRNLERRVAPGKLLPRVMRIISWIAMLGGIVAITSMSRISNNLDPVEAVVPVAATLRTAIPIVPSTDSPVQLTLTPTAIPIALATDSPVGAAPWPTAIPIVSVAASPIQPAFAPTALAASPASSLPGGRRFVFYYDNSRFEIYNASGSSSGLTVFAFERLDAEMSPTNRMAGGRLAAHAPGGQIYAGWCVRIKFVQSTLDSTSHTACQGTNSVLLLARSDPGNFWTAQEGSTWFRVLWNGTEVARCEISKGTCEAFLQ